MVEERTPPDKTDGEMDYPEHEKTYTRFLHLVRYGLVHVAALLVAMAVGFFTSAGVMTALIVFLVLSVVGYRLVR